MPQMKLEEGYIKADSNNLSKIDAFMVLEYIKNDDRFNDPEVRNAKANLSSRQNYGDSTIGYVSLRRDNNLCILKAKICPEHKIRNSPYSTTVIINEEESCINSIECDGCSASLGGCKHVIAFLMWVHRRSEEPSPTEIACYWKRSALASAATIKKFITAQELSQRKKTADLDEADISKHKEFFQKVVQTLKEKQVDCQISRHWFSLNDDFIRNSSSLHQLMLQFEESGKSETNDFLVFIKSIMTESIFRKVEELTRAQSENHLWYELRYGRITASKIYETVHCKTKNGSLVNEILGAVKFFESKAMKRGKVLEKQVLAEVKRQHGITYRNCGLLLPDFSIIGASPDAINNDIIIEVKYPASAKGFEQFLPHAKINNRCEAQMLLQILCAKKDKGLFCVADPEFEKNKKMTTVWLKYDNNFSYVVNSAVEYWKENIFPRLKESVKY